MSIERGMFIFFIPVNIIVIILAITLVLTCHKTIDKISAIAVSRCLRYGEEGSLYTEWDDGNPAQEDEEIDSWDPITKAIQRKDDMMNDAIIENHNDEDLKHYGQSIPGLIYQKFHTITF